MTIPSQGISLVHFRKRFLFGLIVCAESFLTLCGCTAARPVDSATQPASGPAEKVFTTEGIGDEIINEKLPVEITADQAAQLFYKDAPSKLAADWQKHLPAAASRPAPGARGLPDDPKFQDIMVPPQDTEPFACVAAFSDSHVIIRISRPAGSYLYYQYSDNLATLEIKRTRAIDALFDLAALTKTFATSVKGIQQGDTEARVLEVLGPPDAIERTQSMGFYTLEYGKWAVDIAILNGRVFEVEPVPPGILQSRTASGKNAAANPPTR